MRYIFLLVLFSNCCFSESLKEYLDKNNQIVISYISNLSAEEENKIEGVKLTDGEIILKGYYYLGRSKVSTESTSIHLFRDESGNKYAYIWITAGSSLNLPDCDEELYEEGQYVLSGDVYTWKAVQPSHGVVVSYCPHESW